MALNLTTDNIHMNWHHLEHLVVRQTLSVMEPSLSRYLPPSQLEGEGGVGGLREISREWEQGKCGRREAREGGWEVSRIPRGLAKALDKKFNQKKTAVLSVFDQR